MTETVKATFATPPLCVPHEYDGSLQGIFSVCLWSRLTRAAEVCLDQPLWVQKAPENNNLNAITTVTQLEAVCRRIQALVSCVEYANIYFTELKARRPIARESSSARLVCCFYCILLCTLHLFLYSY